MTYHGGCEVTKSVKWIANVWIDLVGKAGTPKAFDGWLAGINPHEEIENKLDINDKQSKEEL